ncbi:NtaA/DmoA family FMN-dependent monooxygenase [Xylophilus sp.]|uniref:NtaA/DmoA family FMN-dependent monooxygenase n=1 Tax=Xylophilus sp. TaxID=2653893 RepID=UPI0013BA8B33|nr:NtaA/DmoA family FMN-dependent monooxygenase [Xylophilus sp.]KAF1050025.1 MAG: Nitrilotriacetate monooxygenase component A [Xylophilus sp.]
MTQRQLHLLLNVQSAGIHPAAWRMPEGRPHGFLDPAYYREIGALAERGLFDAVFLADHSTLWQNPAAGPGWALDPLVTLAGLAAHTTRIGLVASISTTFSQPYPVARAIASLDHASAGRAGWNVVTSWDERAARNFDIQALPPREDRYRRAAEFVGVVRRLWDSWEPGALVADAACGLFADPARIHAIDHAGAFHTVRGPLQLPRTPQGRPAIFQAGGSEGGRDLAARHADAVFTAQADREASRAYRADLQSRAAALGRTDGGPRVFPGVIVVTGRTEAEARGKRARLDALLGGEPALLARFARALGVPVQRLALERPFPEDLIAPAVAANPRQGFADALAAQLADRGRTVRDHLEQGAIGQRSLVGSADAVADALQQWFEGGAADGFVVMCDILPGGLADVVELVVPRLQERGIYPREYAAATLRERLAH